MDIDKAVAAAHKICLDGKVYERRLGLIGIWGQGLQRWLQDVLPHDAHKICRYLNFQLGPRPSPVWIEAELLDLVCHHVEKSCCLGSSDQAIQNVPHSITMMFDEFDGCVRYTRVLHELNPIPEPKAR